MEPDRELVQVPDDHSFKVWSHGYPYRTVRWHFPLEYKLHLVAAAEDDSCVADQIGPRAKSMPPSKVCTLRRDGRRFASAT